MLMCFRFRVYGKVYRMKIHIGLDQVDILHRYLELNILTLSSVS